MHTCVSVFKPNDPLPISSLQISKKPSVDPSYVLSKLLVWNVNNWRIGLDSSSLSYSLCNHEHVTSISEPQFPLL